MSNENLKDIIVGGKVNTDLITRVEELRIKRSGKRAIEWDIKELEEGIKQELVDLGWFDLLSVNWSKVNKLK